MGSQMTPELEVKLAAWLADRAPATTPPEFVERILAIPRTTPIDRRRGLRVLHGGRRRTLLLVAATLTSLGIVGGGLILAGMQDRHEEPPIVRGSPVPVPSVTAVPAPVRQAVIPETIPSGIDSGAVDTPLGTARWIHWQSEGLSQPDPTPVRMPDGRWAWFQRGTSEFLCGSQAPDPRCTDPSPALWVSDDLLAQRRPVPLPTTDRNAEFFEVGGRFWFLSRNPQGIWWSSDLAAWETGDESAIRGPGSDIPWIATFPLPTTIAGMPALWVHFTAKDPGALLGFPGQRVGLEHDENGYFAQLNQLRSEGGPQELGRIEVRKEGGSIRFLGAEGHEVGRVDGVGMEFVDAWVRRHEIVEQGLFLLDGSRWVVAELPLGPFSSPGVIDAAGPQALALATDVEGNVRLVRSSDGRTWTGGDVVLPIERSAAMFEDLTIDERDGVRTYSVNRDGEMRWASTDGITWKLERFPEPLPGMPVPGGWVRTPDQSEEGLWQVSRDRESWLPAPELSTVTTKITPNGAGGSNETNVGDAIWFSVNEDEAPYTRDVWVVEFDKPES